MENHAWFQTEPLNLQQYRNEDIPVDKQRLLVMKAASTDDCAMLDLFCSSRPSETPLIHSAMCRAASCGHLRAFKTLARYCEDIHADDSRRATNTIISSIVGGQFEVLDFILASGGDINRPTQSGRTALTTALSLGRWDLLTLVLSRGADVAKLTADGRTCLCVAATMGRLDLVEALIQYGASVNCGCRCFTPGRFDRFHCVLDVAILKGHRDVVRLLLNYGSLLFRESDLFLPVIEALLDRGESELASRLVATGPNINCCFETNNVTPLCLAVQRGSFGVAQFLTTCGANIHQPGQDGPPLCYAVLKNSSTITDWLIRSGADVNAHSKTYGSAIHIAVEFGFVGLVDMLLRNGAEVYVDSPKGYPLQIARQEWRQSCTSERQRRFESIIDLLRKAGATDEETRATPAGIYDAESSYDSVERHEMNGRLDPWLDWG